MLEHFRSTSLLFLQLLNPLRGSTMYTDRLYTRLPYSFQEIVWHPDDPQQMCIKYVMNNELYIFDIAYI
jgi:hypothetical protein